MRRFKYKCLLLFLNIIIISIIILLYKDPQVEGWPPGKSLNMKNYINDDHMLSPNKKFCSWTYQKSNLVSTKLLILVKSAAKYFKRRNLIRQTWANLSFVPNDIKIFFIVGLDADIFVTQKLEKESQEFCDVMQTNSIDHYMNNTLKMVSALGYFNNMMELPTLEYLLITDDDTFTIVTDPRQINIINVSI